MAQHLVRSLETLPNAFSEEIRRGSDNPFNEITDGRGTGEGRAASFASCSIAFTVFLRRLESFCATCGVILLPRTSTFRSWILSDKGQIVRDYSVEAIDSGELLSVALLTADPSESNSNEFGTAVGEHGLEDGAAE